MNINLTLIVQMLVFIVLIWFTMKFVWPMILGPMEERSKKIAQGLAAADRGEQALVHAKEQADGIIREARERANTIIDQAQHRANELIEEAKGIATTDANRIKAQAQEQVTLDIKNAVTTLQSDVQSIQATRIARELSEENLRNQQARYDVGLATTKDILDFQDQLTQARFAEVNSLTRYRTDLATLHRAEGTLLERRRIIFDRGEQEETPWWAYF